LVYFHLHIPEILLKKLQLYFNSDLLRLNKFLNHVYMLNVILEYPLNLMDKPDS